MRRLPILADVPLPVPAAALPDRGSLRRLAMPAESWPCAEPDGAGYSLTYPMATMWLVRNASRSAGSSGSMPAAAIAVVSQPGIFPRT